MIRNLSKTPPSTSLPVGGQDVVGVVDQDAAGRGTDWAAIVVIR